MCGYKYVHVIVNLLLGIFKLQNWLARLRDH